LSTATWWWAAGEESSKKKGREGWRAIDSGSRGSQPLYLQGHTPTKLDKMAKSKKRQFTPLECLMGYLV
jgi:hypothetical protein